MDFRGVRGWGRGVSDLELPATRMIGWSRRDRCCVDFLDEHFFRSAFGMAFALCGSHCEPQIRLVGLLNFRGSLVGGKKCFHFILTFLACVVKKLQPHLFGLRQFKVASKRIAVNGYKMTWHYY